MFVFAKRKENRLKEISTTGQAIQAPYPFDRGKPVLPKVSALRRKLAEKAKREPQFFLRHLSQRPFKPPEGMSWYEFIYKKLKLYQMKAKTRVQALR